jgi:CubicO group peptidase (beta-lactamase class C family)
MAEARTGETWHSTIHRRVLKPLGLTRTMTRVEDIPPGEAAHCHVIRGGKARAVPLKPTAVLNAAGGMYVSGRDTAKFLKVFATDGRSAGGKIDAETLRLTWQPQAVQKVDFGGLLRDSYGLGWDLGAYEGRRYASRSGGYHGCRSYALWVPELKFGVTVLSVGEVATHQMNIAMIMQAIDLWTQNPEAATRAVQRIGSFQDVAAKGTAKFQTLDPRLVNPAPLDAAVASAATGSYRNDRLGEAAISLEGGKLVLTSGVLKGDLVPQADGGFRVYDRAALDTQPLKFSGSRSGTYDSFLFDDDQYERMR